jgi:hypothetical protein
MLDSSSWTWGLCLIVLTTAIHSLGIVLMSILGLRIRAGLKRRRVAFWQGVAILTGLIAAIGLSLAVLHGIEAALWAAAYLGLGALDNAAEAMLFSIDSMTTRGASGLAFAPALAGHGCAGSGRRHADVRCQHGLCFRGHAVVLADTTGDPAALTSTAGWRFARNIVLKAIE